MCGFLALASTRPGVPLPHGEEEFLRMRDTLVHRGPDAAGAWRSADGTVALLHRRLKIIDLEGGAQPMAGAGGRIRVAYNGEIYNFRELRAQLEDRGRRFASRSDTEVLLAAYEAWGPACVERFDGIFAFALWDEDAGTLLLARDPLGVKPLYYGAWNGCFYAASEAKAIVADPRVPREVDPVALDLFLHESCVPAPHAIWRGMRKLRAGERLLIPVRQSPGEIPAPERYYELPFGRAALVPAREEEVLEALDEVLARAVRQQAVSDVPLGAFLSGGVDSSLLVGYLAEHAGQPVHTFSVSFEGDPGDEAPWAEAVSRRYGTEHHRLVVGADRLGDLERLAWYYDEPFADPAAVPTAILSAYARERVTVALSGDGGDETHAGYPRYRRMALQRWMDRIPLSARRAVALPLSRAFPSDRRRGGLDQLARTPEDRWDAMTSQIPPHHRRILYSRRFLERLGEAGAPLREGAREWRRFGEGAEGRPVVDQAQRADLLAYLPEQLMTKLDRASMAASLEGRVPFLGLEPVAFAASIPVELRMRGGTPKHLLRRLLAGRMGEDFVSRKKQGFTVPRKRWTGALPDARVRELLSEGWLGGVLDPRGIDALALDPARGRGPLWPLLALAHWAEVFAPSG